MNFKHITEIEASFRRIEQMLDAMLEESRTYLERERIALRDDSNRSGFDKGFPYFVWGYQLEKREAYRSEIKVAAANLRYLEPSIEEEAQIMSVTSIALIFQIGKQSRVREIKERLYPIEEFLAMKLNQVIMNCIVEAEQVLAAYN
jgi:hypothetical protein